VAEERGEADPRGGETFDRYKGCLSERGVGGVFI